MKNLAIFAIGVFTFAFTACKNVDKGLVQEMQQTATSAEALKPATESAAQSVADFKNKVMELQDAAMKGGALVMSSQIEKKYNSMMETYAATQEELKKLTAEYEGGKLKTEAVSLRFTELKTQLSDIEAGLNRLKETTSRPLAELAEIGTQIAKAQGISAADAAASASTPQGPSDAQSDATGVPASDAAKGSDAAQPVNGAINAPLVGDGSKKGKQ